VRKIDELAGHAMSRPERPRTPFPVPETLYCAPSPEKRLLGKPQQHRE
jgi:hypothetical protein